MSTIFINYRRADAEGDAGRLHNALRDKVGDVQIFLDVDDIDAGTNFVKALDDRVKASDVMLVLIGRSWTTLTDAGRRRLDDPEDFVVREIATALRNKVSVVPVLVQGATMSVEKDLPDALKPLATLQAVELRHSRYDDDVRHLASQVRRILGVEPLPGPETNDPFAAERRLGTWTAVAIVAVVLFLVIRNDPIDPSLIGLFRAVLSLGIAIIGATVSGFLNIQYNRGGIAIRTSGAMALYLLTYIYTPSVRPLGLSRPVVEMDRIQQIDFRTSAAPDQPEATRAAAQTYATIPLSLRSLEEPAAKTTLDGTAVRFTDGTGATREFRWRNFVTMHEERYGVWLGIDEDAHPLSIGGGETVFKEILHAGTEGTYHWSDFVSFVETSTAPALAIEVVTTLRTDTLSQTCNVDLPKWRDAVKDFRQKTGKLPGRITMSCIQSRG